MKQVSENNLPVQLLPHLADIAKAEGLAEYTIEHEPGTKPGDGFMSELIAVTLVGKDVNTDAEKLLTQKRVALICKLQPTSSVRQEQSNSGIMFEREVFVYNRLLPLLVRLQRHHKLTEETGFYSFPKCYVAAMDVFNDESLIIMEDLRSEGYAVMDKSKPFGLEEATLFVQQLGKFHGLSFVLREQRPEVFADFIGIKDHFNALIYSNTAKAMFDSCYDRAARLLEKPEDVDFMKKLREHWQRIMRDSVDPSRMGRFGVFGHGDCWNNNLMFKLENGKPTKMCLVDWQFSRPASPVDDLVMFLCSTTEKKLREDHYHDLLKSYHDSLTEIVQRCSSDPEKLFTFEDLESQLSPFGTYGVIEAPLTVSLMVVDSKNFTDMNEFAETAKTGDGNTTESSQVANFNQKTEELYKQRLTDVLEDARKYGWSEEL